MRAGSAAQLAGEGGQYNHLAALSSGAVQPMLAGAQQASCNNRWKIKEMPDVRHPNDSQAVMTEHVLPQHTNFMGTCFGGTIMSWIDIAAGICAGRHAGTTAVTVAFDDVHFITPIRLGDVVNIVARICFAGTTSMEIRVDVFRERFGGPREHANTAYVVFVAVDAAGKPFRVPALAIDNDADRLNQAEAIERRAARMAKVRRKM